MSGGVASAKPVKKLAAAAVNPDSTCAELPDNGQGGGANQSGPYDENCIPAPSGNGLGGGNAFGQPLAGTVGNADNQNPQGQLPGPQDNNNGYECDGNNGIARTNPAHTGCEQSSS